MMLNARVLYSRDVIFDELKLGIQQEQIPTFANEVPVKYAVEVDNEDMDQDEPVIPAEPAAGRLIRDRRPPGRYGDWVNLAQNPTEPASLQEAMRSPDKAKQQIAIEKEMTSLQQNVQSLGPA